MFVACKILANAREIKTLPLDTVIFPFRTEVQGGERESWHFESYGSLLVEVGMKMRCSEFLPM